MGEARDLTRGSISGHLVRLAGPLILGNILQQLYNTIDAWVVGHYAGDLEFASIGLAGSVMNLFLFAIVGACTGISVIFARFYGARDLDGFRREHFLALVAGSVLSLLAGGLGILCTPLILRLVLTPVELMGLARNYISIVLLGLPLAFIYNLYNALLRSVGRTGAVLLVLAAAVAANLGLDMWFVSGLGWGIKGAALATVLAQALSALLCLIYIRTAAPELLFTRRDCVFDRELLAQSARYSFVTALHESGLYIGKLLVQGAVDTAGTAVISAYTAATRIEGFANSFGSSGAAALSVVAAQNLGSGQKGRVREAFRASLRQTALLGIACSLIMFFTADYTVGFMLGAWEGSGFESGVSYIKLISFFYLFCFTGNSFCGYFDGLGRVSIPTAGAIGHITLRVILSWLMISRIGLPAVALATGIGWICVNIFWGAIKRLDNGG